MTPETPFQGFAQISFSVSSETIIFPFFVSIVIFPLEGGVVLSQRENSSRLFYSVNP